MKVKILLCALMLSASGLYALDGSSDPLDKSGDPLTGAPASQPQFPVHVSDEDGSERQDSSPELGLQKSAAFNGVEGRTTSGHLMVKELRRGASTVSKNSDGSDGRTPVDREALGEFMKKHPFCSETYIQYNTHQDLTVFLEDLQIKADAEQREQIVAFLMGISSADLTKTPMAASKLVELLHSYPHDVYTCELMIAHIKPHIPSAPIAAATP